LRIKKEDATVLTHPHFFIVLDRMLTKVGIEPLADNCQQACRQL